MWMRFFITHQTLVIIRCPVLGLRLRKPHRSFKPFELEDSLSYLPTDTSRVPTDGQLKQLARAAMSGPLVTTLWISTTPLE